MILPDKLLYLLCTLRLFSNLSGSTMSGSVSLLSGLHIRIGLPVSVMQEQVAIATVFAIAIGVAIDKALIITFHRVIIKIGKYLKVKQEFI